MGNQHTKAAEAAAAAQGTTVPNDAPNDAPDLGPEPATTVTMTADELAAMLQEAADTAARAVHRQQVAHTPTATVVHNGTPVQVLEPADPPLGPTYEDGYTDDEGVAYAATIVCVGPKGDQVECTPKVFRTIMAGRGYVAHPDDAVQHLNAEPRRGRRARRAANIDGTDPELVTASRRRRRATPVAE